MLDLTLVSDSVLDMIVEGVGNCFFNNLFSNHKPEKINVNTKKVAICQLFNVPTNNSRRDLPFRQGQSVKMPLTPQNSC